MLPEVFLLQSSASTAVNLSASRCCFPILYILMIFLCSWTLSPIFQTAPISVLTHISVWSMKESSTGFICAAARRKCIIVSRECCSMSRDI